MLFNCLILFVITSSCSAYRLIFPVGSSLCYSTPSRSPWWRCLTHCVALSTQTWLIIHKQQKCELQLNPSWIQCSVFQHLKSSSFIGLIHLQELPSSSPLVHGIALLCAWGGVGISTGAENWMAPCSQSLNVAAGIYLCCDLYNEHSVCTVWKRGCSSGSLYQISVLAGRVWLNNCYVNIKLLHYWAELKPSS